MSIEKDWDDNDSVDLNWKVLSIQRYLGTQGRCYDVRTQYESVTEDFGGNHDQEHMISVSDRSWWNVLRCINERCWWLLCLAACSIMCNAFGSTSLWIGMSLFFETCATRILSSIFGLQHALRSICKHSEAGNFDAGQLAGGSAKFCRDLLECTADTIFCAICTRLDCFSSCWTKRLLFALRVTAN